MPDRLASLILLVGFWIPPAVAGWSGAGGLHRSASPGRAKRLHAVLVIFVVGYATTWFLFNLGRMPPYIPGALPDPTSPPSPRAVLGLAVVSGGVVLPGSALACALAFRRRRRLLRHAPTPDTPA